jgi:hypothetical protein
MTKDGQTQYVVVQKKGQSQATTLYSSEPLHSDFVHNILLSPQTATQKLSLTYTDQIISILKKIGRGELQAAALLNAYEAGILKQLKSTWAQELVQTQQSRSIPTPPLVFFTKYTTDFPIEPLQKILWDMKNDPEGQEILRALRLQGFRPIKPSDYDALGKDRKAS